MDDSCTPRSRTDVPGIQGASRGRALTLSLAAMIAALLVPTAWAQEGAGSATGAPSAVRTPLQAAGDLGPEAAGTGSAPDPRTRPKRWLLHAVRGGVLRALARWSDDHWEFQRNGQWESLPAGAIDREQLESVVLTESRKRRAAVRRNDTAGLTEHARWLIESGLYTEGVNLLSEVLESAPDQPEALALLASGAVPVALPSLQVPADELPAARSRLLQYGAAAPRSLQELAIVDLREACAEPDEAAALRAELVALLTDPSGQARAFAALALRRLVPGEAVSQEEVEEFLRRALQDVSSEVRSQATLALRDVHAEGVILPIVKALESPSPALRRHAAESLGELGFPAAVPPLVTRFITLPLDGGPGSYHAPSGHIFVGRQIAYIAGFSVNVAQNAAIGDPEIGTLQEGASIGVSVLGSSDAATEGYLAESKALRTALTKLTGANPGATKSSWKAWWAKNQDRWTATAASTGAGTEEPASPPPAAGGAPR